MKIQDYERIDSSFLRTVQKVDANWEIDKILMYLYVELPKYFQRDPNYFFNTQEEKMKQYQSGFINNFPLVVCKTLSDFYVCVFNEFGIEAETVTANSAEIPLYGIVVKGDNGYYFLNPLQDLFYCQYNLRPTAFARMPRFKTVKGLYDFADFKKEKAYSLHSELGFNFLDDYFNELKSILVSGSAGEKNTFLNRRVDMSDEFADNIILQKILFCEKELINLGNVNGPFERAQLHKFLVDTLFDKREKKNITILCDSERDYSISCTARLNEGTFTFLEEKDESGYHLVLKNRSHTY